MENLTLQPENPNTFNFDMNKVQVITLDQLKRTQRENDSMGKPLNGLYHYEVIEQCAEVALDAGLQLVINEIFAAQNRDKRLPGVSRLEKVEAQVGEYAVEAHILRRVFANMELHTYDTDEFTSNLAIAFHQDGIQIAFGNMVKICHNQCILRKEQLVSSYGKDKKGFTEMFNTVGEWMRDSERIIMEDRAKIERMKRQYLQPQNILEIIGELTTLRVMHDSSNKLIKQSGIYPLNATQINQLTEDLLIKRKKMPEDQLFSVWDVYDAATHLYKATRMEIPNLLPQNVAMAEYLTGKYSI